MALRVLNTIRHKISPKHIYLGIGIIVGSNLSTIKSKLSQLELPKLELPKLQLKNTTDKIYLYSHNIYYIPSTFKNEHSYNHIYNTYKCCKMVNIKYSYLVTILDNDIVNETFIKKLCKLLNIDTNLIMNSDTFNIILQDNIRYIINSQIQLYIRCEYNGNEIYKKSLVDQINRELYKFNYRIKLDDFDIQEKQYKDFFI
jgi:hypothetical protein